MEFPKNITITGLAANSFDFKKSQTVRVPGRTYHGLTFRRGGKISILPEGADRKLVSEKNCITYVPKGCTYDTEIMEDGGMYILHFEAAEEYPGAEPFVFRPTYPIVFANLFKSLDERFRYAGGSDYACFSIAYEILSELYFEMTCAERSAVPRRMRLAKEYIDENYGNREMTVAGLAKDTGVSEVYFRREFRACFGAKPIEYIKKVRIENAKALLSTAMYPVSEVATRCGFDSISYFSYEFRRVTGETPREFSQKFEEK